MKTIFWIYASPFLPQKVKIDTQEKRIWDLSDKEKYFAHVRNLQQALNHGLIELEKSQRVIKLNPKDWLKA